MNIEELATLPMLPESFTRAIIASPLDDLPRLVAADWLEENAGLAACGTCRGQGSVDEYPGWENERGWHGLCPHCNGTGTVSNGYAERAEFIRVQCELAGLRCQRPTFSPGGPCDNCKRREALRQRERELMSPGRWNFPGLGWTLGGFRESMGNGQPVALWERGFVSTVRAPLAALVGGTCERCGGIGYRSLWNEDFPRCSVCHGTGTTTGIAREIAKVQPVTRWEASDKEPVVTENMIYWPCTAKAGPSPSRDFFTEHDLPELIYDLLEGRDYVGLSYMNFKSFDTREDCLAALSDAIGKLAKQQPENV